MSKKTLIATAAVALIAGGVIYYYMGGASKKSAIPPPTTAASETLVFTSPPRESPEEGELIYKPIAEYLSKVTGKRVVYRHPGTWGVYRTEMINGTYDIVFDGPHFVDYRVQKLRHNVLAKVPEPFEFVIFVRKEDRVASVGELAGQTFCTPPPPNQGALLIMSQFTSQAQQPIQVPSKGWPGVYDGIATGKCRGGIMPFANLKKLDKDGVAKVVLKTPPTPNQAFTASSRVAPDLQARIAAALTAPEASAPTAKLREAFKVGDQFVAANNTEYSGYAELLRQEWGFF
jgi:ABC-type phosphate/phosphonate transport system substrate-binding protein